MYWPDQVRAAGGALRDGDLVWTDSVAHHRVCGKPTAAGARRKPFRSHCEGCGDALTARQVRWCSKTGPHGWKLCDLAWHKPGQLWRRLLAEQNSICHICDRLITETVETRRRWDGEEYQWTVWDVEVDHIDPLARGGPRTYENLAVAHRACNQLKKAKPLDVARAQIAAGAPGAMTLPGF